MKERLYTKKELHDFGNNCMVSAGLMLIKEQYEYMPSKMIELLTSGEWIEPILKEQYEYSFAGGKLKKEFESYNNNRYKYDHLFMYVLNRFDNVKSEGFDLDPDTLYTYKILISKIASYNMKYVINYDNPWDNFFDESGGLVSKQINVDAAMISDDIIRVSWKTMRKDGKVILFEVDSWKGKYSVGVSFGSTSDPHFIEHDVQIDYILDALDKIVYGDSDIRTLGIGHVNSKL